MNLYPPSIIGKNLVGIVSRSVLLTLKLRPLLSLYMFKLWCTCTLVLFFSQFSVKFYLILYVCESLDLEHAFVLSFALTLEHYHHHHHQYPHSYPLSPTATRFRPDLSFFMLLVEFIQKLFVLDLVWPHLRSLRVQRAVIVGLAEQRLDRQ